MADIQTNTAGSILILDVCKGSFAEEEEEEDNLFECGIN